MYNIDSYSKCYSADEIKNLKGQLVENSDGSVSVFIPNNLGSLSPIPLGQACCKLLNSSYIFDINTQQCRWTTPTNTSCDFSSPIQLAINSNGNDGSLFIAEDDNLCDLKISFDYLFKIKCETLNNIVNPQTIIDAATTQQINTLTDQISQNTVTQSYLQNQILLLQQQIDSTMYSIHCDSFPSTDTVVLGDETPIPYNPKPTVKGNFGNTGFGNLSPMSMPRTRYFSVNFCLTEPSGLSTWANILGPVRYQQFLAGDPSSYTCDDVINIYNQNQVNPGLIIPCKTTFGTKTQLVNEQNGYLEQLSNVNNILDDLNSQLTTLEASVSSITGCKTPLEALETLDISMNLNYINPDNTLTSVFSNLLFPAIGSGNLYTYLTNHSNSGFYICGNPSNNDVGLQPCTTLSLNGMSNTTSCNNVLNLLLDELHNESGVDITTFNNNVKNDAFSSNWLHYETLITDSSILSKIANKKIKLTLNINNTCVDVCILLDNIVLSKSCDKVETQKIELTKSPGFNITRVRDNKKSWVDTTLNREFLIAKNDGTNPIRQTDYDVNDERLVINTKEIDLDINIAGAIESDVWTYVMDNPCLLTGSTLCEFCETTCCGDNKIDFSSLLTTPLSSVTTIESFENLLLSELIDAKDRKTITSYATLRALYDRYLNSNLYCGNSSSGFDYTTIDNFSNLIGNYWIDIIEQVIPATTIWGSVKIYSNTIFDEQKFKYRKYSSLLCGNPFNGYHLPGPIEGNQGQPAKVEVVYENIPLSPSVKVNTLKSRPCTVMFVAQMNAGSEFIGSVTINDVKGTDILIG